MEQHRLSRCNERIGMMTCADDALLQVAAENALRDAGADWDEQLHRIRRRTREERLRSLGRVIVVEIHSDKLHRLYHVSQRLSIPGPIANAGPSSSRGLPRGQG